MTRTTLIALAASLFTAPAWADVTISAPQAAFAYQGGPTAGAYFILTNPGGPDDRLLSAHSDLARRTEVHDVVTNADGTMGMQEQTEGVALPADGEVRFAPGGYHIMLMGISAVDATEITVTLTFEQAGEIVQTFPVVPRDALVDHSDEEHDATMDHSDH